MRPALIAEGVGKSFRHRDTASAPTFRAWVEGGFRLRRPTSRFWAVRGISLAVTPGEMVGIIGRNGSGKSTLLRLLGGVMQPEEGRVCAAAPVRGLLELNTGMHPDLSGRENIVINGVISGLLKSEILTRMEEIIAFAELEDHIDQPVRTYSSGMKLRLGFAIAVHVDPQILLIDEVLAVGDLAFQEKCLARIGAFRAAGCAIVLISHDMGQVRQFCDRVLWLDRGTLRAEGDPDRVVAAYERAAHPAAGATSTAAQAPTGFGIRYGSGAVRIGDVRLTDRAGNRLDRLEGGSGLSVRLTLAAATPTDAHVSISIADAEGRICFDANSETDRIVLPAIGPPREIALDFDRLDLAPGRYLVSVGAWRPDWAEAFDMHESAYPLEVVGGPQLKGPLAPPRRWRAGPG